MGGNVSSFDDNESLIDSLKETYRFSKDIERVLRLVDRRFYSSQPNDLIYSDSAWRSGDLHLSAPSIYCMVLREMDLGPGLSVLNIGSGTGYLSTIFGLILGSNSVNHGIEVSPSNFLFSKQRLLEFLRTSDAVYEFDFCPPHFILGNIFTLVPLPSFSQSPNSRSYVDTEPPHGGSTASLADITVSFDFMPHSSDQPGDVSLEQNAQENSDEAEDHAAMDVVEDINCSGYFAIDNPPLLCDCSHHNAVDGRMSRFLVTDDPPTNMVHWPTYDRIYVGSEITSQSQLEAIFRLLKVGGILIAPVNDRLMKITRTGVNTTSALNLLNVSFVSLSLPRGENLSVIEPPPQGRMETLERLTCRTIRRQLRQIITCRRNGPPVLGRYETMQKQLENDSETGEHPTLIRIGENIVAEFPEFRGADACGDHQSPATCDSGISLPINESTLSDDSTSTELPSSSTELPSSSAGIQTNKREASPGHVELESSPPKKRCDLDDDAPMANQKEASQTNSRPVSDEGRPQSRQEHVRIASPYVAILASILNPRPRIIRLQHFDINASADRAVDSIELQTGGASPEETENSRLRQAENEVELNCQTDDSDETKKIERRWIPQSYTYREEMLRLLSEETDISDFLIQRLLSMI